MMNKKDLSVTQLQSLNRLNVKLPLLAENLDDLIVQDFNDNKLLRYKDIDEESDFKFEIKSLSLSNGSPIYMIESAPSSTISNKSSTKNHNENGVIIMFQTWIGWLKVYDKSHLTPEDEILKAYEEEFYSEFEIIDEGASKEPFSLEQQLYLDEYLKISQKKLELLKKGKTEKEVLEIDDLVKEAETIKQVLTKESKKKIVRRLSKFWGKARKTGVQVIREIFVEIMAEIGKRMIMGK